MPDDYSVATVRRLIRAGPDARQSLVRIHMNKVQGIGITERILYSVFLWLAMMGVKWGYWDADMAAYIAAGAVAAIGSVRAWWINRPSSLLSDAAAQLPKNSQLEIVTTAAASSVERRDAHVLANAASDKVVANTAA